MSKMQQHTCEGNGLCLMAGSALTKWWIAPPMVWVENDQCPHRCEPVRCPNYDLCKERAPLWYLQTYGGVCFRCQQRGLLRILPTLDDPCPVCLDTTEASVRLPCGHQVCVSCYDRPDTSGCPCPLRHGHRLLPVTDPMPTADEICRNWNEFAITPSGRLWLAKHSLWLTEYRKCLEIRNKALSRCPVCRAPSGRTPDHCARINFFQSQWAFEKSGTL